MEATAPTAPLPAASPGTALSSSTAALPPPFPTSSSGASTTVPVAAGLLLVALAVATFLAARRRKRTPRLVEIVESSSLGPKRSLVVARIGDELLLLGASEGGITLLSTRPAPARPAEAPAPGPDPASRFQVILGESADDVDLRRKLAAGTSGSVR